MGAGEDFTAAVAFKGWANWGEDPVLCRGTGGGEVEEDGAAGELGGLPPPLPPCALLLRFINEFQRFFTAFSGLPGNSFAISHHLLPILFCAAIKVSSSASLHGVFFTLASKWFNHLSRHCLPILPETCSAITLHFFAPNSFTNLAKSWSSSGDQGPLIRLLLEDTPAELPPPLLLLCCACSFFEPPLIC